MPDHQGKKDEPSSAVRNDRPWAMADSGTGGGGGGDVEAAKDPGALKSHSSITDAEMMGHHNVDFLAPLSGRSVRQRHGRHSRGGKGHHHRHHKGKHLKAPEEENRPVTPPAQRVQFILGEDQDGDSGHEPHPLFSEMEELCLDEDGEMEWKETARWVKFEEDVEEGGNRWSKPHVATLSLHSLFELRSLIVNGAVCLDVAANNLDTVCELVLDNMVNTGGITFDKKAIVKDAILKRHRHQHEGSKGRHHHHDGHSSGSNMSKLPLIRSLAEIGRNHSSSKNVGTNGSGDDIKEGGHGSKSCGADINNGDASSKPKMKMNAHFMKKLPKGAEASNILVGELNSLERPLSAFIRLSEASPLGDLTEVPVATRFLYILLGPAGPDHVNLARYHEIGRAVATIMSDEVFHEVAYKAKKREHLLAGIDEFLDAVTVLPPGEWDPSIRIEPPQSLPSQDDRRHPNDKKKMSPSDEEDEEQKEREESGLVRSGRFFGGLINDIKRKKPFYLSDFKDALAVQSVASYIFIYFACLTPIITFGGLLGDATENRIAAVESLISGLIVGVTYGFFSGQPLTILGSTGPILVFETIMYDFCKSVGFQYLPFRFWTGMWVGVIMIALVAFDASAFVCYITRFTEENFACLIALIFIKKAIDKVLHIADYYPIFESDCFCQPTNDTLFGQHGARNGTDFTAFDDPVKPHKYPCEFDVDAGDGSGTVVIAGLQSVGCHYVPNAFLMSVLLFIGTFLISRNLKGFKSASFFPAKVRGLISDFAVIIAIITMVLVDYLVGVPTPKMLVPDTVRPTWEGRTWLIHPFGTEIVPGLQELPPNPWWTSIAAVVPAILASILIFMDQQITAVIVNRKEHKLKKGGGYHLDLLIVSVLIVVCSIFGLPWFVAATVLSINHVKSLTVESETAAPGEKPQFLGIREQRVTHILIFFTIGLSVFFGPFLALIPMPVLYGVFLYMGVAALDGIQFFDRICLFFMPKKYQPDRPYLRSVPLNRVHLFTCVQLACLVGLWVIKDIKATSILFPVMLVVMIGVRKGLDKVFLTSELKILDDILPHFSRGERMDDEEKALEHDDAAEAYENELAVRRQSLRYTASGIEVPMANGNVIKIPVVDSDINISEEMNKSGLWKSVDQGQSNKSNGTHKNDGSKKEHQPKKRMSVVKEGDDEDVGIQIKASGNKSSKDDNLVENSADSSCASFSVIISDVERGRQPNGDIKKEK